MPFFVGFVMIEEVGQLFSGDVEHVAAVFPRLEAEVAMLVVEWIPRHVNLTVCHRLFKQRPPDARAVVVDAHVVRLRRRAANRLLFRTAANRNRIVERLK